MHFYSDIIKLREVPLPENTARVVGAPEWTKCNKTNDIMPSFTKRNGQYQWRSQKDGKAFCESLPLNTPMAKVRQIEGQMNAAYYGSDWDPRKIKWKEYQRRKQLADSGLLDSDTTVEDAIRLYIKDLVLQNRISSGKTKYQYEQVLTRFCNWLSSGPFLVSDMMPEHGGKWLQSLDVNPDTKGTYGVILSGFYSYLNQKGFINHIFKYHQKADSNNERAAKIKYLTEAQKDKICEHYRANREDLLGAYSGHVPDWMDYDGLINVLFYQGFRIGEIFDRQILRRDISLSTEKMTVTGKRNKTRKIDITPEGGEYIKKVYLETKDPNQNIFPHSEWQFRRILKECAKQSLGKEYDWVSPHNLRHSCGTYWASQGVPIPVIQKLLGHTNINTTLIYAQITDNTSRNAFRSASNIRHMKSG